MRVAYQGEEESIDLRAQGIVALKFVHIVRDDFGTLHDDAISLRKTLSGSAFAVHRR